jgi:hypothetical protein
VYERVREIRKGKRGMREGGDMVDWRIGVGIRGRTGRVGKGLKEGIGTVDDDERTGVVGCGWGDGACGVMIKGWREHYNCYD